MKYLKYFENSSDFLILYHGTSANDEDFYLDPDLDWEDIDNGNVWDIDMPSGYIFLTNDINEAKAYGRNIIKFKVNKSDIFTIEVDSDAPSREFDKDYNYGSKYHIWETFMDTGFSCLEVKGYRKSTFVCSIDSLERE